MRSTICLLTLLFLFSLAMLGEHTVKAQPAGDDSNEVTMQPDKDVESKQRFNLPIKTTGGTQLWTDVREREGYRIQQHAVTGHFRLLDPTNVRLAWGGKESCIDELDRVLPESDAISDSDTDLETDAVPRHTVVMLHGLMRTRHCMKPLEQQFIESDNAYRADRDVKEPAIHTIRFSYSSTRRSMGQNAAALRELLEHQPSTDRFSFVGHSMGNIVVRHLIGDLENDGDPKGLLPRMEAMVMLGPPNQGATIARRLAPTKLYGWVTGAGGLELGPEWEAFSKRLSTPSFPFLIIAGDVSKQPVQNPLVDGAGDFVVSLEEASLEGAEAIESVPLLHSFLMDNADVTDRIVQYIESKWDR